MRCDERRHTLRKREDPFTKSAVSTWQTVPAEPRPEQSLR